MDFSALVALGLLVTRIGALVMVTPVLGGTYAPAPIKVGLTLVLALVLMPFVALPSTITGGGLVAIAGRELLIGLAIAMSIRVLVGAAELGGYLVGFQLGFSYAGIVDPQSGVRNNVLAAMYASLTVLTLIGINAHHAVLRVLVRSYETLPIGGGGVHGTIAGTVADMLGLVFYVGVQLAAPVVIALCVAEVLLGIVTRAAPSLNLMVVGAPVRLLIGLVTLTAAIQVVPGVMGGLTRRALELGIALAAGVR